MGNYCGSCGQHSRHKSTAKLISANGKLQEFSHPIKVSHVLQQSPGDYIICSSESMEFDELLVEINGDEVLEIGEVYFELPLRWRNRRLSTKDVADLAVKATTALSSTGNNNLCCNERLDFGSCRGLRTNVLVFNEKERPLLGAVNGGGGEGHKFVAKLSAIVEE